MHARWPQAKKRLHHDCEWGIATRETLHRPIGAAASHRGAAGADVELTVQGYGAAYLNTARAAAADAPIAGPATQPYAINILNLHLSGHFDKQHGA